IKMKHMRSTFKVLFFLKRDKQKNNGSVPVYCRITIDGKEARFGMKKDINPNLWNVKEGKATGKSAESSEINALLETTKAAIHKIYRDVQERENAVSAEKVKNIFLGIDSKQYMLLKAFDEHVEENYNLIGKRIVKSTYYRYYYLRIRLSEFLTEKYHLSDIPLREINYQFIRDFEMYLLTVRGNKQSTIAPIVVAQIIIILAGNIFSFINEKLFIRITSKLGSSFEIVQGMVDLKLNNAENYRIKEWENKQNKIYLTKEESLVIENKVTIGNTLISQIKNAFITFICAYLVINKSLTLGEMLSISYIIGALNAPLGTFLDFIKKWNETKFSFLRINEVNEMSEEDSKASKNIDDFEEIIVKEVSFRYSENSDNNILNDISINIKKGQKIAFVGKSGSGKTTMMKLLL